ncbi:MULTISPECIES: hypothetical protein [Streptomyces]
MGRRHLQADRRWPPGLIDDDIALLADDVRYGLRTLDANETPRTY